MLIEGANQHHVAEVHCSLIRFNYYSQKRVVVSNFLETLGIIKINEYVLTGKNCKTHDF